MTRDDSRPEARAKGVVESVKGKLKDLAGNLAGDEDLEREGEEQQAKGEAQREAARREAEAERARIEAEAREAEQRAHEQ